MIGFKSKKSTGNKRRRRKQKLKKKYIRYAAFAVISYVIFLITSLPASVAVSFVNNNPMLSRQLQLSAVSGTLWSGSAASVQISGINIGKLNWNLKLLPLLLGELSVYVNFRNQMASAKAMSGSGTFAISFSGDVSVENFMASFSADSLGPLMYGLPARFSGDVNMHIDSLSLVKGRRINLKSRIVVSKAGLVSPQRIDYGDILIQASPQLTGSQLVLTDQGGPLILDGNIKIKGNGLYTMNLGLGARNSASQDLRNGLRFLGQRDATGKYRYKSKGKLGNW